jgi:hypothetical protein
MTWHDDPSITNKRFPTFPFRISMSKKERRSTVWTPSLTFAHYCPSHGDITHVHIYTWTVHMSIPRTRDRVGVCIHIFMFYIYIYDVLFMCVNVFCRSKMASNKGPAQCTWQTTNGRWRAVIFKDNTRQSAIFLTVHTALLFITEFVIFLTYDKLCYGHEFYVSVYN